MSKPTLSNIRTSELNYLNPLQTQHLGAKIMTIDRRTVIKSAAWSVPLIAAVAAAPLAAVSTATPEPVSCVLLNGTGSPYYAVTYSDGETVTLHRSKVAQDKKLRELCKVPARNNEGE